MRSKPGLLMSLYDQQHEAVTLLLESRGRSERYRARLFERIARLRAAIRRLKHRT